jgi:hypothetical protein
MKQRVYTIILTKRRGIGEEFKGVTILSSETQHRAIEELIAYNHQEPAFHKSKPIGQS